MRNADGTFGEGNKGKPKGAKSNKTKQWEQLGDFLTEEGAQRAMKILNDLPDEEYLDQFGKLLNYYKPKMQSTNLDANLKTESTIEYKNVSKQYPDE